MERMPHIGMTMDTRSCLFVGVCRQHVMDKVLMTMQARVLSDFPVARFDPQRIGVVVECERQRMEESVVGLGYPFADRIVRQVAIVTDGDLMMARLFPGVVRLLHHMAVDAGLRIVTEVAGPFAVAEGERSKTDDDAEENRKERGEDTDVGLCLGILSGEMKPFSGFIAKVGRHRQPFRSLSRNKSFNSVAGVSWPESYSILGWGANQLFVLIQMLVSRLGFKQLS